MELGPSSVASPIDFTPGFIKSSPSGSGRRPQRGGGGLGGSSSSMRKGDMMGLAGRHKVIPVSLQQDVKLHTADNAWKPVHSNKKDTASQDDDDAATQVTCTTGDAATPVLLITPLVPVI